MRDATAKSDDSTCTATFPQRDLLAAIPRLRRYARVLTGDRVRADDLVQDTLTRAWAKRGLWKAGSDLRAWLFAIMHNVFVGQLVRSRHKPGTLSLDAAGEEAMAQEAAADGDALARIELHEVVQQLSHLPAEQREILLLCAVEELRYDEIAAMLAIPVGTVMSRLSRARSKLRRLFAEPPALARSTAAGGMR
jgi:RNA polymerase sigma-70 factor (ECF subfamily)